MYAYMPHDCRRAQLVNKCLKLRPSLLGLCIASGTQNWEPRPGLSYLNNVTYFVSLLAHTPEGHELSAGRDNNEMLDDEQLRELVGSWIPRGM